MLEVPAMVKKHTARIKATQNGFAQGLPGVDKTHLATSQAVAAAESGRRVYYATLQGLITCLEDAQQAGHLTRRLRTLVFPSLVVIDDIDRFPILRTVGQRVVQLMSRRYEHASTVLTSNTPLGK